MHEEANHAVLREPSKPMYTKKQVRKLVHNAFKAGLINTYHARPDNDLSRQNSRLFALKRGKTVHPSMATPLLALQRSLGKKSKRLIVVHRTSRSSISTSPVASGVEALDLGRFIEELIRPRK